MEWINISEQLPEENRPVILFTPFDYFGELHSCVGNSASIRACRTGSDRGGKPIFTHWLPLPATPENQQSISN